MPKIKVPKGTEADVSQFDASGALEQGVKQGINLISPLVSIYRNKVEREAAVEAFRQSVRQFANSAPILDRVRNAWTLAGDWLAVQKPRVAAHIRQAPDLAPGPASASMEWMPLVLGDRAPGKLHLTDVGAGEIAKTPALAREYMAHEATHAAQALGNRDAPALYNSAMELGGYQLNPFEVTARRRGTKAKLGLNRLYVPPGDRHAIKMLRNQLEEAEYLLKGTGTQPNYINSSRYGNVINNLHRLLSDRYGR